MFCIEKYNQISKQKSLKYVKEKWFYDSLMKNRSTFSN